MERKTAQWGNAQSWIEKDYVVRITKCTCVWMCIIAPVWMCFSVCATVRRHAAMRFRCRYYVHMNVFPVRVV